MYTIIEKKNIIHAFILMLCDFHVVFIDFDYSFDFVNLPFCLNDTYLERHEPPLKPGMLFLPFY